MSISTTQYHAMLARTGRKPDQSANSGADKEVGSGGLHSQIEEECRRRVWGYITNRTDRKSTSGIGVCDFVIAADNGRTFYIELKSKTGKQSQAQRNFQALIEHNGHRYHLVRSLEQFLEITSHGK